MYIHTHIVYIPYISFLICIRAPLMYIERCMYVHIYTYMYIYVHIYIHIYTHIYTYICIYIPFISLLICIRAPLVYVYVYIYRYTYMYINTHIYTYMYLSFLSLSVYAPHWYDSPIVAIPLFALADKYLYD
jgi:hypothetical protein